MLFKTYKRIKEEDMGKYKYIRTNVYRRGIAIFIGSREELLDFTKKAYTNEELISQVKNDLNKDSSIGTCYIEDLGQSLIWIPKFPRTVSQISALAHEVLHATFTLLDFVGVEYRYEGPNEPYTYLFEYFLTRALTEKGYKNVE